ncbi:hypothetical protein HDU97_004254 [Phlyctochytrium planicorne]|nr:hypothetical protein HDU97_004254 [Phlyctochytrium planicorne]
MSGTKPTEAEVANRLNVDVDKTVYKNPATTVDALVIRKNVVSGKYELLVIQRGRNPYQGYWALPAIKLLMDDKKAPYSGRRNTDAFTPPPNFAANQKKTGGFIEYGEDPEHAAGRELEEESKLKRAPGDENIHLITVRGKGDRDPRQHIITIAYAVKVEPSSLPFCAGDDDAKAAKWIPLDIIGDEAHPLAFDHVHIVNDLRNWFKKEGEALGFYVVDNDPKQPGETSTKNH